MKAIFGSAAVAIVLILVAIGFVTCSYTLSENENAVITQFGKPVEKPVTTAGIHFKTPFIQAVNVIDARIREWDGQAVQIPTRDKLYIIVDSFARWRITDPLLWFTRLRDERSTLSRMEDIIGSENRNAIAKHELIEIVRTDKQRKPVVDITITESNAVLLPPISVGRTAIEKEVLLASATKLKEFGIELIDVRFMRINYGPSVTEQINNRMISERKQIADRYRSEGGGDAAKILGRKERDLQQITSEAYREAQKIRGQAEAQSTEIYARAYNQSPAASELYGFLRTMEAYKKLATSDTTLVLSTDSELFRYLKTSEAAKKPR
jgi:modulator of FtsH protease HflC